MIESHEARLSAHRTAVHVNTPRTPSLPHRGSRPGLRLPQRPAESPSGTVRAAQRNPAEDSHDSPRQGPKSTGAGPAAVDRARLHAPGRAHARPRDPRVLARSFPDFVSILACLETTLRIRAHMAHYSATPTTSPISTFDRRPGRKLRPIISVPAETSFQILDRIGRFRYPVRMAGTPRSEIFVTESQVSSLIADQHSQFAGLPVSLSGEGWDNFTFRLGEDLAVRLPRRALAVDLLLNEQRWLKVATRNVSLPVPRPVAIGAAGHGYPWPWSIVPWIDGTPVDHAPLDAEQGSALAAFLHALHRPAPADAPANPTRGVRLETRREGFAPCLDRLRTACDLITPAIDAAWRRALAASSCDALVWLHGDLHAQNVLSLEGRLAGVIDWGDMCSGDPAVDLCSVWGVLAHPHARAEALRIYAPDDALLARARGWAILFGASLFDNGRIDDPRHAAIGEATLRRLDADL